MTPQLLKLIAENKSLKDKIDQYRQATGLLPYIDDSVIKGGYHVVKTIVERDAIDCCHRKLGMKVLVIGEDFSFKEYVLKSNNCKENIWQKRNTITEEDDVTLVEDYSELEENLTTQKELNLVLKELVLNLQTTLDNKVDKVIGKQLSTEDYTTAEKNKLAGIQEGAEVNVNADWNATSGDAQILNLPSTFTPSLHTHSISEVDNLQNTLDGKEQKISTGTTSQYWRGDKTWQNLDKNSVGLSNVDNTSDLNKPISTATQQALNNKLDKGTYTGIAQGLKDDIDTKQKQLSSFDESILIETDGNIEGNISLFEEYFEQQECELNFNPIQIVAVYQDGIKLSNSEYEIILPKKIKIKEYVDENIQIEYTHLKN